MIRRFLSVVALAITGLLLSIGIASADDYVPSAVTTGAAGGGTPPTTSSDVAGSLSYTGAGFNVGGAVLIAAIVLLVGVGLVVTGAKMARRRSTHV